LVGSLVEESAFNLGAIHVDELNFKQRTAIPSHSFLRFRGDARLNLPVARESVESFDGHVHGVDAVGALG